MALTGFIVWVLFVFACSVPTVAKDSGKIRTPLVAPATEFSRAEPDEHLSGGATTSLKGIDRNSFSHFSANLSVDHQFDFKIGQAMFNQIWTPATPSSQASDTQSTEGLGPLFNARSCQSCHLRDGRGHPPDKKFPADKSLTILMRLSIPPQTKAEKHLLATGKISAVDEPTYGGQLQDQAVAGLRAEGRIEISYKNYPVVLAGGVKVFLRKPTYSISDPSYGPLHRDVMMSVRVAPPMIGLGLLEAVASRDILALADAQDANGDGISGRPNMVWSIENKRVMPGRFGWKAGQPSIAQQNATALAIDIGISSSLRPRAGGDCTLAQMKCLKSSPGSNQGDRTEISKTLSHLLNFYTRTLAVPTRRNVNDATVLKGKELFYRSGCTRCHNPKFRTGNSTEIAELKQQLIWPYTDLLLHDMGPGLADKRPEGAASGREWRTPALWGIGLSTQVNGHTFFLHDGRARNLLEAILWHGGEAQGARDNVAGMSRQDRLALLAFLRSL